VRVGRAALDEDAIRLLEANHPDLQFDWTRILKGQADPESPASERRLRKPERHRGTSPADRRPVRQASPPVPESRPESLPAPAGATDTQALSDQPITAAHARLGSEGLGRLRARYAETMARITERIQDPEQQSELKLLAERLNPDAWVTDEDVSAGLESYETTFETLRGSIGTRRRKPAPEPGETRDPSV
jgi:hypothetical protein